MMFTSYAQNFEDVILWRALKHVENGFYIDIGAQDPIADSVSLAFYERGWRGVHVEPTPAYAARLRDARPDEDTVEAAIAQAQGVITLFEFAETGLSTGKDDIAQMHAESGFASKSIEVAALPLSDLFERYPDRDIHWLKIDVEGMESDVIASWQSSPARPWIVVVESTLPRSQEPDYSDWEPALCALGYEFVYFDGLNRFYLHRDHAELRSAFGRGPNFFDDFSVGGLSPFARKPNQEIAVLRNELKAISDQRQIDLAEISRLHHHIADTEKASIAERATLIERASHAEQQAVVIEQLTTAHRIYERLLTKLDEASAEKDAHFSAVIEQFTTAHRPYERLLTKLDEASAEKDAHLSTHKAALAQAHAQLAELNLRLAMTLSSTSWRLTAPLRGIKTFAHAAATSPKAGARQGLEHALTWLRRSPRALALAKSSLRFVPPLDRRLRAFSAARQTLPVPLETGWALEPPPEVLDEWRSLLKVKHTA